MRGRPGFECFPNSNDRGQGTVGRFRTFIITARIHGQTLTDSDCACLERIRKDLGADGKFYKTKTDYP